MRRILSLAFVVGICGCSLWQPVSDPVRATPPGRDQASPLALSQWTHAALHCDAGECAHWYRIEVAAPGRLRIDINAPAGSGVPDFDVRLEDADGDVVWGFAATGHSPRKIERVLSAGAYYLLVEAIGEHGGLLAYEAFTTFDPVGPVFRADESRKPKPVRDPMCGPEVWIAAEILQLEGSGGLASAVVLDVGSQDDVRPGHRGELFEGGEVIATFELVEVDPARSRGRLDGAPSDAITYETRARIRVPFE